MKLVLTLCIFLISTVTVSAQIMSAISGGDTLVTSEHVRFIVGEDIKLGTGTMDNGSFKFVTPSRKGWATMTGYSAYKNIPAKFNGHVFQIKSIREYGNKKHGYAAYIILASGEAENFECDIENALKSGEVVVEGYTPPLSRPVIVQQANTSVADELAKLKKLKDDGVLSESEYQVQKKKILER